MLIPVILSGGVGSRLWPISRNLYPKQFLPLVDKDDSMLHETLKRLTGIKDLGAPIVICNEAHRFLAAEQLRIAGFTNGEILLEPEGRNTAPAVALAALHALQKDSDVNLLILPADHVIGSIETLHEAIEVARNAADQGSLVTFGVTPTHGETGYGYIKAGEQLSDSGVYQINEFLEKPNQQRADAFVEDGNYYWNSGKFLFKAAQFIQELEKYAPEIVSCCSKAINEATYDMDFIRINAEAFLQCPSDSVDYALMERTQKAVVIPLDAGWSDVGSWAALWQNQQQDKDGNVIRGDVVTESVKNSYIRGESRLVAVLGVEDVVVVETSDAVLVTNKNQVQGVKAIVEHLKNSQRDEIINHRQVFRPWGSYESLVISEYFQVKRIIVNPGQSLSLQLHKHRSEHWIVVKGEAQVVCGDQEFILKEDQSTYIPQHTQHRLSNLSQKTLEIIEVQTGSYLGEDDIIRLEDNYGR